MMVQEYSKMNQEQKNLNLSLSIQMAAPHTWPASVIPVLFSGALVYRITGELILSTWIPLILISILMQSAANIFNDYFDLLRGTDTKEDCVEPEDSVLVYNRIPPKQALILGIGTLFVALLLAIYPVMMGGPLVLAIGVMGGLVLLAYSAGSTPLSSLPVGELASGITMGAFIPLACVTALVGDLYLPILIDSIPITLGISLMMMTNNTCDIERDLRVHRTTLPILLGRPTSRTIYRLLLVSWILLLLGYFIFRFPISDSQPWIVLLVCVFLAAASLVSLSRQLKFDLNPPCRPRAMKNIAQLNGLLGLLFTLWLVL